jgi:hypothetical protein
MPTELPSDEPAAQGVEYDIIVNGRERTVAQNVLSFEELVVLAFGPPNTEISAYTLTFQRGPEKRDRGILVHGESAQLKSGMIFNVVRTDRS